MRVLGLFYFTKIMRMLKNATFILFLVTLMTGQLGAQIIEKFIGAKSDKRPLPLDEHFSDFDIYSLDLVKLKRDIEDADGVFNFILELDGERYDLSIIEHDIRHPDYVLQVMTDTGIQVLDRPPNTTFRGWNNTTGDGDVRLTITDEYLAGVITSTEGKEIFLQPIQDFMTFSTNEIIAYREADVMTEVPISCGANVPDHAPLGLPKEVNHNGRSLACMEAEVAIAADYSMYQKFGNSTNTVANHLLTIKNMMEANYSIFEMEFSVKTNFIVATSNGDPWTASNDSRALLESFSCWGATGSSTFLGCTGSNGFNTSFDVAELWSDRDFSGTTIGRAWINSVCSNFFKYSVNEHFSSNNQALRALIAHEVGHNFGSEHDGGGGWIMSSPLSASYVNFSPASQNMINSALGGFGCFTSCGTTLPVHLSSFSALLLQDLVQLLWETQTEIGFDHFELEHCTDGVNFEFLTKQNAKGAPSTAVQYNYTHLLPENGDNYYRLKMTDRDGTISYSEVEVVRYEDDQVVVFPNPASHEITVKLKTVVDQTYHILTLRGMVVRRGEVAASSNFSIPINGLRPGIYLLQTDGGGQKKFTKFSVQ